MKRLRLFILLFLLILSTVELTAQVQTLTLPQRFKDSTTTVFLPIRYLVINDTMKALIERSVTGDRFTILQKVRSMGRSESNIVSGLQAVSKANDSVLASVYAGADGIVRFFARKGGIFGGGSGIPVGSGGGGSGVTSFNARTGDVTFLQSDGSSFFYMRSDTGSIILGRTRAGQIYQTIVPNLADTVKYLEKLDSLITNTGYTRNWQFATLKSAQAADTLYRVAQELLKKDKSDSTLSTGYYTNEKARVDTTNRNVLIAAKKAISDTILSTGYYTNEKARVDTTERNSLIAKDVKKADSLSMPGYVTLTAINTAVDSLIPPIATTLNGSTQWWQKTTPALMDLNGAERITNANNRGFEVDKGDWTDAGTHTIVRSTTDKRTGVASGKIVATGIGDATTNYVTIAASTFTTLVLGEKYTLQFFARSETATTTITAVLGTKTVTSVTLSTVAGTFTQLVLNFEAAAGDITQPLIVYLSKAATVYIDDVSLTQAFDGMGLIVLNTSYTADYQGLFGCRPFGALTFWDSYINITTGKFGADLASPGADTDGGVSLANVADGRTHIIGWTWQRDGNGTIYIDGVANGTPRTITKIGSIRGVGTLQIGRWQAGNYTNGLIGACQFVRFTSLPADIATTIAGIGANKNKPFPSSYTNGTIVGSWDWKSGTGYDKSGTGNTLTGNGTPGFIRLDTMAIAAPTLSLNSASITTSILGVKGTNAKPNLETWERSSSNVIGAKIDSNFTFTAAKVLLDSMAYGGAYIEEATKDDSITVTSSVTYYTVGAVQPPNGYKLTASTTLKNVTVQDSSVTVSVNGVYEVTYSANGRSNNIATGDEIHGHLFINDVSQVESGSDGQVSNTGIMGRWVWGGNTMKYTLKKNDILKVKMNSPDDAAGTVIVRHFNISVTRIE